MTVKRGMEFLGATNPEKWAGALVSWDRGFNWIFGVVCEDLEDKTWSFLALTETTSAYYLAGNCVLNLDWRCRAYTIPIGAAIIEWMIKD